MLKVTAALAALLVLGACSKDPATTDGAATGTGGTSSG